MFIFAAVSTLAQTAPGQPATPKPIPANAAPVFDVATIEHGDSGIKQWKFAVVSIRENNSGGPQHGGVATADGYQMKNLFLWYLIRIAYVPQTGGAAFYFVDQLIGMPAWLTSDDDRYDVDAKVDEADLADWQNPAKQPAMLRSMLQAMLEDRLKLVVHRSTREGPVDLLVLGKRRAKIQGDESRRTSSWHTSDAWRRDTVPRRRRRPDDSALFWHLDSAASGICIGDGAPG